MRRRSRLSVYKTKKDRKTILLSLVGIIIVLFILYKFGIEALINFSLFVSGNKDTQINITQNKINYIAPPVLNSMLSATNSAEIIITGKGEKGKTIVLYINRKEKDSTDVSDNGDFEFEENLSKGENLIQVKTKYKDKESDFSNFYTITFQNSPPKLDVSSPSEGDSFHKEDKSVNVRGQTDGGVTVTVNGFYAVIDEGNNFSYTLPLHDGDNQIQIVAVDNAGNKSEKSLKVNYSQ
jgi:hypothetical protein